MFLKVVFFVNIYFLFSLLLGYDTVDAARRRGLPKFKMVHGGHRNRKWKYLLNGISLRPDSNGYTHICDHAGLACDTADIARRWLVSGIQDGGHHFRISVVGRRRKMSTESYPRRVYGRKYGVEVRIAAPSLTVEKLFPIPI